MPARGHSTAPKFQGSNARELRRYFDELEYLFGSCSIASETDKKRYAVRYLDVDTEDGWKQLPQYTGPDNYNAFKDAVLKLYPGANGDRQWTLSDLDELTGTYSRTGFRDKEELGIYHRKFLTITGFLKSKSRMSENEIKRAFVRGYPTNFWKKVLTRLHVKKPDTHPDDPWEVQDVFDATEFILHDTSSFSASDTTSAQPADTVVKREELMTILEQFSQTIVKALEARTPSITPSTGGTPRKRSCFYDGCEKPGACEKLKSHLALGWCKRNEENRIALPTGAPILSSIPGKSLAERVENWNKENAAKSTSMFFALSKDEDYNGESTSASAFTLQDVSRRRIEDLEREVFELRKRQIMDAVEIPRRTKQPRPAPAVPNQTDNTSSTKPAPKAGKAADAATSQITPKEANRIAQKPTAQGTTSNAPSHPFAAANDSYMPPFDRNFAAKQQRDKDFAYRTTAPIQSPAIVSDVFSKTMKAQCVTLSAEEIMSISPDVRAKVREVITPKRVPNKPAASQNANIQAIPSDEPIFAHIEDEEYTTPPLPSNDAIPPPGVTIIADPVEQFLQHLSPEEISEQFKVAEESFALRSIHVRANFRDTIEAVVDPGSSIISMSEAASNHLNLTYDPSIFINMESANRNLNRTLGLARNVHCKIGNLNLYLQVHIIRNPAYDMLLGRPFDVLTNSKIQNFANGDQTITIFDPNSRHVCTIPTFRRSRPRFSLPAPPKASSAQTEESGEQDFQ